MITQYWSTYAMRGIDKMSYLFVSGEVCSETVDFVIIHDSEIWSVQLCLKRWSCTRK